MSNIWISYKAMQVMHNNIISLLFSSLKKLLYFRCKIISYQEIVPPFQTKNNLLNFISFLSQNDVKMNIWGVLYEYNKASILPHLSIFDEQDIHPFYFN